MCEKSVEQTHDLQETRRKAFSAPQTATLPEFRVKEVPAFSKVGVDFARPLSVKAATGSL